MYFLDIRWLHRLAKEWMGDKRLEDPVTTCPTVSYELFNMNSKVRDSVLLRGVAISSNPITGHVGYVLTTRDMNKKINTNDSQAGMIKKYVTSLNILNLSILLRYAEIEFEFNEREDESSTFASSHLDPITDTSMIYADKVEKYL